MTEFSTKCLDELGGCYVYALIDPRNNKVFYIGKGSGNRVFYHERESLKSPDSEKLKLKTIAEIKDKGLEVKKVIVNWNLSDKEAFAAEASLINLLNYQEETSLSNIDAGHHSVGAFSVEDFETFFGAKELKPKELKHHVLVVKINQLYTRELGKDEKQLYEAIRGNWSVSKQRAEKVDYVFGVYKSLIVGVYKPSRWIACEDAKDHLPRGIAFTENEKGRMFFVDKDFDAGKDFDENEKFYRKKSLAGFDEIRSQSPFIYLDPES